MALSPSDIQSKEFHTRMRGFDQDQVNDFLSQLYKDYSAVLADNEHLKQQLADAQEKVNYFNDLKDALNQSIIVAQEAADKVKKNADQEATLIQQEAEKNAQTLLTDATDKSNRILADASDKAKTITVQTEDLKRQTRIFRQRLQVMLESQLEVVKSPEWKEILKSDAQAEAVYEDAMNEVPLDNDPQGSVNLSAGDEPVADGQPVTVTEPESYTEIIFPDDPNN